MKSPACIQKEAGSHSGQNLEKKRRGSGNKTGEGQTIEVAISGAESNVRCASAKLGCSCSGAFYAIALVVCEDDLSTECVQADVRRVDPLIHLTRYQALRFCDVIQPPLDIY